MQKYQIIQTIGNGNSSIVYKAKDKSTKQIVAIKYIFDHEDNNHINQVKITKRLLHPNIIQIKEVINIQQNEGIHVVLQYISENLLQLYTSSKCPLTENQIKCILFQLILALEFIHKKGIIHRDIKPQNILIDKKNAIIKIIDFGSAKKESQVSTDYISTRWYRSPQVLLSLTKYSCAIDIFAVGCIALQLFTLKPIFPGDNTIDQLNKIFNILGSPTQDNWPEGYKQIKKKGIYFAEKVKFPLRNFLPTASRDFLNLIQRMVQLNPSKRINSEQALQHNFFKDIKNYIPQQIYKQASNQLYWMKNTKNLIRRVSPLINQKIHTQCKSPSKQKVYRKEVKYSPKFNRFLDQSPMRGFRTEISQKKDKSNNWINYSNKKVWQPEKQIILKQGENKEDFNNHYEL